MAHKPIPGLTYAQSMAVRRIVRLHRKVLAQASTWDVQTVEPILVQMETIIDTHFKTARQQVLARRAMARIARAAQVPVKQKVVSAATEVNALAS